MVSPPQIRFRHITIMAGSIAIVGILIKWTTAVLLQKLVMTATGSTDQVTPSSRLFQAIFLESLSIEETAFVSLGLASVLALLTSITAILSFTRGAATGRKLRSEILLSAVSDNKHSPSFQPSSSLSSSSSKSSPMYQDNMDNPNIEDIGKHANEIGLKIRLIEEFQTYDESRICFSKFQIILSFMCTFIVSWRSSLVALGCLLASRGGSAVFTHFQKVPRLLVDENSSLISRRLLDVIRNATKVKMMQTSEKERADLETLEKQSDKPLQAEITFRFARNFVANFFLGIAPFAVVLVAIPVIQSSSFPENINMAFSVLVTVLLLDDAHKGVILFESLYDKLVAAKDAQAYIDIFLAGKNELETKSLGAKQEMDTAEEDPQGGQPDLEQGRVKASDHDSTSIDKDRFGFSPYSWNVKIAKYTTQQLRLERLTLTYPDRIEPVFSGLNMAFKRGSVHGIIGESGSGKSTLLKVVARFLHPDSGSMQHWAGMKVAYVSQDQKLFARSIRENVRYGTNESDISEQEVWQALDWANIGDWVRSLPNGIDEVLESAEDDVSGGQLQRLQLAQLRCRCQDADLVILDECLSAVDQKSRELLIDRLGEFLKGKTALIVTHHNEMLRICSEVHTMEASKTLTKRKSSPFLNDISSGSRSGWRLRSHQNLFLDVSGIRSPRRLLSRGLSSRNTPRLDVP